MRSLPVCRRLIAALVAVSLSLFVLLVAVPPNASARGAAESEQQPTPWDLVRLEEGEPAWAPLLRLRQAEGRYQDRRSQQVYAQIRAQKEAAAGDHAAALRWWDSMRPASDSVGALPAGASAVPAIDFLSRIADTTQVVMINERHHAASDRLLTLRLLTALYEKGFRYFAAEAFSEADSLLGQRAYAAGAPGTYTREPVFAEVIRQAQRLGYTFVPYEITESQRDARPAALTRQQHRDRAQAQNLYDRIFRQDPEARVVVHAGFSHVLEEASDRWYPMALYFREIAGIDPLTVDQTRLSERSAPGYEHPAYRAAIRGDLLDREPIVLLDETGKPLSPADFAVDVQVLTPRTRYVAGRPGWMDLEGRRAGVDVSVPECRARWCYVEARAVAVPAEAPPLDRAEAVETGTVRLFMPKEEAVVRIYSRKGTLLRTVRYSGGLELEED